MSLPVPTSPPAGDATVEAALAELAEAARAEAGGSPATPGDGPPLLEAFRAAGAAIDLAVVEPPRSARALPPHRYVQALAASSRFRVREVALKGRWWERDAGPLVGFTAERRPVALVPAGARYRLVDPEHPTPVPLTRERAEGLLPRAYMLHRPFAEGALTAWELASFGVRHQGAALRAVAATLALCAVLGLLAPVAFGFLVDSVIPGGDRPVLLQLAGALVFAALGRAVFELVQAHALVRIESASTHDGQAALWDRLLAMRPDFFRAYPSGDLVGRALSVSHVQRTLSGATLRSLLAAGTSLLNVALLFWYSAAVGLLALGVTAVALTASLVLGAESIRRLGPLLEGEGRLMGLATELVQGVSKLRLHARERAAFARWTHRFADQVRQRQAVQRLQDALHVLGDVLPVLATTLLFWLASRHLVARPGAEGGLTTGAFLASYAAFGALLAGVGSLGDTLIDALPAVAMLRRAEPILSGAPEVDSHKADPGVLAGRLDVDHVRFRYRRDGPPTLSDVSLHAAPGEFVAIVGPSGSGKSTLLRLLLGFEQPESGGIAYDGQNLAGLDVNALRRQLGVVLQSGTILTGSIYENISAGAALALDDAWAAAADAGLEEDLRALPMGMHTVVSEGGGNLSGGQRQRLLIARALARRPAVVFFDEATSALDNRTQAIVSRSLDRLQVTRVVIAHRLSTIQRADRIYVIEAGRLVQQGTFAELAAQRDGLFARMMARQML